MPDIVGCVRGWAFDLHMLGYAIHRDRVTSAENAAVAALSLGASVEEALELARMAFEQGPIPQTVSL